MRGSVTIPDPAFAGVANPKATRTGKPCLEMGDNHGGATNGQSRQMKWLMNDNQSALTSAVGISYRPDP
jgi:hypothetical protein